MTGSLLTLLSLVLSASALIAGVLAALVVAPKETGTSPTAWAASALGVLGLVVTVAAGSQRPLDLATVAGAGWAPPGRTALLALGVLCLAAGLFARFDAPPPDAATRVDGRVIR